MTAVKQLEKTRLLRRLFVEHHRFAEQFDHHRFTLFHPTFTQQPARRFRKIEAPNQDQNTGDHRAAQHPAPSSLNIIKPVTDQIGTGGADIPHRGDKTDGESALAGIGELGNHRGSNRIIGTNHNADQHAHHQQLNGRGNKHGCCRYHANGDNIDDEHFAPPDLIGNVAKQRRPHKQTGERAGAQQTNPLCVQFQCWRELFQRHANHHQHITIQKWPTASPQHYPAVNRGKFDVIKVPGLLHSDFLFQHGQSVIYRPDKAFTPPSGTGVT